MRLYELTQHYERLLQLAEEGDDSDELVRELDATVEAIDAKGTSIAMMLRTLNAEADAVASEEQRLRAKRERLERSSERLREYLRANMAACGITSIKHPAFSISLRSGPARVVVDDEKQIPAEYMRTKTTKAPDKVAILKAFTNDGECVPGTHVETSLVLTIR